jgi:hypothetical protein
LDQSKFDEPDTSDSDYESNQSDSEGDNHPTNRLEVVVPPLTRPQSDYHLLNQIQTIHATINNIEIDSPEPTTYKEIINSAESKQWQKVIQEEFNSLIQNNT